MGATLLYGDAKMLRAGAMLMMLRKAAML